MAVERAAIERAADNAGKPAGEGCDPKDGCVDDSQPNEDVDNSEEGPGKEGPGTIRVRLQATGYRLQATGIRSIV